MEIFRDKVRTCSTLLHVWEVRQSQAKPDREKQEATVGVTGFQESDSRRWRRPGTAVLYFVLACFSLTVADSTCCSRGRPCILSGGPSLSLLYRVSLWVIDIAEKESSDLSAFESANISTNYILKTFFSKWRRNLHTHKFLLCPSSNSMSTLQSLAKPYLVQLLWMHQDMSYFHCFPHFCSPPFFSAYPCHHFLQSFSLI